MKKLLASITCLMALSASAQEVLSHETLWKLGRVTPIGISKDGKQIVYKVSTPSVEENKSNSKFYIVPVQGGTPVEVVETKDLVKDKNILSIGVLLS